MVQIHTEKIHKDSQILAYNILDVLAFLQIKFVG